KASEAGKGGIANLVRWITSKSGKVESTLHVYLRHHRPTQLYATMTKQEREAWRKQVLGWAEDVSERLELVPGAKAVLTVWRPVLVKQGLLPAGGRPANGKRCELIQEDMDAAGITPETHEAPAGFWPKSAARAAVTKKADSFSDPGHLQKMFW